MQVITKSLSVGLLLSSVSMVAIAESWILTPIVTVGASYDDNFRLTRLKQHDDVTGLNLAVALAFDRVVDDFSVNGKVRLDFNTYDGDDIPDDNNQSLKVGITKKAELSKWSLVGLYTRDSTLKDISEQFDADDPSTYPDTDAGITTSRVRRKTLRLIPSWETRINERTRAKVSYELKDIGYENVLGSSLTDFTNHKLTGSVSRNLSERDLVRVGLSYQDYDSDAKNSDYDSVTGTLGYDRDFDETFRGGVEVGYRTTEGDKDDSDGAVFKMFLSKRTETANFYAHLQRSLSASGAGDQNETDQLLVRVRKSLSPTLALSLNGRYQTIDSTNNANNRDYFSFGPRLTWNITQWWSIDASYSYRWQEYDSAVATVAQPATLGVPAIPARTQDADSSAVFISVTYSKPTASTR